MKILSRSIIPVFLLLILLTAPLLSGCAAALLAGGAVGGYAVAKDLEDGELIDTPKKQNKGWLSGISK
jgi:hypothetical protein